MNEIWKDVPGWEGYYQVSNLGNVKSVTRDVWVPENSQGRGYYRTYKSRIVKSKKEKNGYLRLTFWKDSEYTMYSVHTLVAITWLNHVQGNGLYINHKNGIKTDNRVDNLELVTPKENIAHALTTGLRKIGFEAGCAVLNEQQGLEILKLRQDGKFLKEIAEMYGVSRRAVENALKWTIEKQKLNPI